MCINETILSLLRNHPDNLTEAEIGYALSEALMHNPLYRTSEETVEAVVNITSAKKTLGYTFTGGVNEWVCTAPDYLYSNQETK